ncbi:MAG: ATP-binding protein [Actinomycetes bacterium]
MTTLLERTGETQALVTALEDARQGRGRAVLVCGEAGIGKTTLVRTYLAMARDLAHVLTGACDDLMTPRALGPLRDMGLAAGQDGPLALASATGDREAVLAALLHEMEEATHPTLLLVEDVHWADDATLDVLRLLARRLDGLRAVVVLTYRDEEVERGHPLLRVLGALGGPGTRRLALRPLTRATVTTLAEGSGLDGATLYEVTGGNPFFVSEALAAPEEHVPATVVDAVLARAHGLDADAQAALEHLAVVPTQVPLPLAETLLDDLGGLGALEEAEERGIVHLDGGALAFRHELARRAIELSLPRTRRIALNRAVVDALRAQEDADPTRIVHHAVQAGDTATVVAYARHAAREAADAGSHREALAHLGLVLTHPQLLTDTEHAHVLDEYAWELYNAHRFDSAVDAARSAVACWEQLDSPVPFANALVTLSRNLYMANRPVEAAEAVARAVGVADATEDVAVRAYAHTYHGAILTLTERSEHALVELRRAIDLAEQAGRKELVALCLNYLGCAQVDLGNPSGLDDLRASLTLAQVLDHHEYVARAWTNIAESLQRLGRFDELERCVAEGLAFTREHDFSSHTYGLTAHLAMVEAARGDWDRAEDRLREMVHAVDQPGVLGRLTLPVLGRILARRGDHTAARLLDRAWAVALDADALQALAPAGIARLEWAWLTGQPEVAQPQVDVLLTRTAVRGAERYRGELLRYLARTGREVGPFAGCPEEYAAGLAGDTAAAAAAWQVRGDPYERALELAESDDPVAALDGLALLDGLGATAAATLVRRRLKGMGVTRLPRGPLPATRANPAGLTERQLDVLGLLAEGLTNTEIAQRLVLSTRTVDHHVSAVLMKLGVSTRQEAVRAAAGLATESSAR